MGGTQLNPWHMAWCCLFGIGNSFYYLKFVNLPWKYMFKIYLSKSCLVSKGHKGSLKKKKKIYQKIGNILPSENWKNKFLNIFVTASLLLFSCLVVSNSLWPHRLQHARLPFSISQTLLKLMSTESVMPSNRLILCQPLLLLSSIFPNIRVFSSVSSSHQVVKVLELQHQSFQWIFRVDLLVKIPRQVGI